MDRDACPYLFRCRIIAGSPRGRFPGGFDDMFPDELDDPQVCQMAEEEFENTGATPRQNRTCFGISGLVYVCRASTSSCEPFLGNGIKTTEDGYLYKRNRMLPVLHVLVWKGVAESSSVSPYLLILCLLAIFLVWYRMF